MSVLSNSLPENQIKDRGISTVQDFRIIGKRSATFNGDEEKNENENENVADGRGDEQMTRNLTNQILDDLASSVKSRALSRLVR